MKLEQAVTKNILIVDDDPLSIFLCESYLKPFYNITAVLSGYDAIKLTEENNYDVILMDINLADLNMDGVRTMKIIRKNIKYRHAKIFAITAFSNNKQWYLNAGFNDMFLKPLEKELLVEKINYRSKDLKSKGDHILNTM